MGEFEDLLLLTTILFLAVFSFAEVLLFLMISGTFSICLSTFSDGFFFFIFYYYYYFLNGGDYGIFILA